MQLVEVRELVRQVEVPAFVGSAAAQAEATAVGPTMSPAAVDKPPPSPAAPSLFADTPEEELLAYGVPAEWLAEIRAATEDSLLEFGRGPLAPRPARRGPRSSSCWPTPRRRPARTR